MRLVLGCLLGLFFLACAGSGPSSQVRGDSVFQEGIASYYHDNLHGNRTASGDIYDRNALTAAHRTLAFGTRIRVTNLENGRSLVLTVNDRGPFVDGRIVDVSRRAARELDFERQGLVQVALVIVSQPGTS